jgi:DNA-binding LytR/AlgR family response regulator
VTKEAILMKINIEIDEKYSQVEVLIMAPKMNEEVQQIINKINDEKKKHIIGVKDDRMYILNPKDIFCFYTENKKIMARTEKDKYEIKDKLDIIIMVSIYVITYVIFCISYKYYWNKKIEEINSSLSNRRL